MIVSKIRAYTRAPIGNAIAAVLSLGNPGQTPWRALHQSRATRRNTRYLFLIKLMKSLIIHDLNFKRRSMADLFTARRIRGHTRIKKTSFIWLARKWTSQSQLRTRITPIRSFLYYPFCQSRHLSFSSKPACHSSIAVHESCDGRPMLFSRVKWRDYTEVHK